MKIAVLVSQYPAASHTFVRREVQALRDRGFEIHTFSIRPPSEDERKSPVNQKEFQNTWYVQPVHFGHVWAQFRAFFRHPLRYFLTMREAFSHRVPGLKALIWALFHFGESMALAMEIQRRGIEHIHNHFANSGANVGYLTAFYLRQSWSLTLHGISEFDYPAGVLLPAKIAAARFVACVSYFGKALAMRNSNPKDWEKMFINRCGVETKALLKDKGPPSSSGRVRWVSVGRLSPEKGQMGLLHALSQALVRGLDVELRIVGCGPCRDLLANEVARLKLNERCTLVGAVSETEALREIAAADIFVLTSFMEGLPVVLMEALGMGVPVVAPRVAGIPELVEDRRSGMLFSPGNWEELADRMEELTLRKDLRIAYAEEGKKKVLDEFAIEHAVDPIARAFSGLTKADLSLVSMAEPHVDKVRSIPVG